MAAEPGRHRPPARGRGRGHLARRNARRSTGPARAKSGAARRRGPAASCPLAQNPQPDVVDEPFRRLHQTPVHPREERGGKALNGAYRLEFRVMPKGPGGRVGGFLALNTNSIVKSSTHPTESWEVLKWLADRETSYASPRSQVSRLKSPAPLEATWDLGPGVWDYCPLAARAAGSSRAFVCCSISCSPVRTASDPSKIWG